MALLRPLTANHYRITRYSPLVRCTLKVMEERLGPAGFLRIHRSTLVNGAHVRGLLPSDDGETVVILRNGKRLRTGRRYRATLRAYLA